MTAPPTEIYTLSLHDALPILLDLPRESTRRREDGPRERRPGERGAGAPAPGERARAEQRGGEDHQQRGRGVAEVDRKSTRLNSSHVEISYAVFCLKKKKTRIG